MIRRLTGIVLIAMALHAPPAQAQNAEAGLKAFVAAIDGSPDWSASYASLTSEAGGRAVQMTGLTIKPERDSQLVVTFGPLRIASYAEPAGGGFTADELTLAGATFETPGLNIRIGEVKLKGVGVPRLASILFDKDKPFSAIVKAYAVAARARLSQGTVEDIELIENVGGAVSRSRYTNLALGRLIDGKLDSFSAGPVTIFSPSPDPVLRVGAEKLDAQRIDLNALLHVFDADQYAGGIGDGDWRAAFGQIAYRNLTLEALGARLTIGGVTLDDFKFRQPPRPFAPLLDAIMVRPKMPADQADRINAELAPNLLSAMGVGRLSLDGLDFAVAGFNQLRLGQLLFRDLSIDGVGEVALNDLTGSIAGEIGLNVGRMSLGAVSLPKLADIQAAIAGAAKSTEIDGASLLPKPSSFELRDLDLNLPGAGKLALGRVRVDLGAYVGAAPTDIDLDLQGLGIDNSLLPDSGIRTLLTELGYPRLLAGAKLKLRWNEAEQSLLLSDFRLTIKDVGQIESEMQIGGVSRNALEHLREFDKAMATLVFVGGRIQVEDQSAFNRVIVMMAKRVNVAPDQFRQQIAGVLPVFFLAARVLDFQTKLLLPLQAFILAPNRLVANLRPSKPVPLPTLMNTLSSPERLLNLLAIELSK